MPKNEKKEIEPFFIDETYCKFAQLLNGFMACVDMCRGFSTTETEL